MHKFHGANGDQFVTDAMIDTAKRQIDEHMERIPIYDPTKYDGRGIVMVAGGAKYIACAYVNIRMLRANGCDLPVEMWYIGDFEMDDKARSLFDEIGRASCRERV